MSNWAGKGCKPRPCSVSQEEKDLRWKKPKGELTDKEFAKQYAELKSKGKIWRK